MHVCNQCVPLCISYPVGYTTDDLQFMWQSEDPVQMDQIALPQFDMSQEDIDYGNCTKVYSTGTALRFSYTFFNRMLQTLLISQKSGMDSVMDFESGGSKFESHCSQHVVVSLGKTLHPILLLWGLSTALNVCKSLWIKASNKMTCNVKK